MNELQTFVSDKFGKIRTTTIDGEPWFVGKDICDVFNDSHYRRSLGRIDETDKKSLEIQTPGGIQKMTCVNESGLYALLFSMTPQKAKKDKGVTDVSHPSKSEERVAKLREFKRWVTSEVLPEIRKTGTYGIHLPDGSLNYDLIQEMLDRDRERYERIKRLEERTTQLEVLSTAQSQQIAEMRPKASYYDFVLQSKDLVVTTAIAKDYGLSAQAFNNLLHNLGIQYKRDGQWFLYQKYADQGYTQTKTNVLDNGHVATWMYWTHKGRHFLYGVLKSEGILPLMEKESQDAF